MSEWLRDRQGLPEWPQSVKNLPVQEPGLDPSRSERSLENEIATHSVLTKSHGQRPGEAVAHRGHKELDKT